MEEKKYVLAVVFSDWTLTEIFSFMEEHLEATQEDFGSVRIDRYYDKNKNLRESNRTLMLIKKHLFDLAISKGLNKKQPNLNFMINKYKMSNKQNPRSFEAENIYLKFPETISYNDLYNQIKRKLVVFKEFGLLTHDSKLAIPVKSRESEDHKGFGYINFSDEESLENKKIVKLLLHDCRLYNTQKPEERYYLQAYWVKKNTKKSKINNCKE